jgi:hypothetical protein
MYRDSKVTPEKRVIRKRSGSPPGATGSGPGPKADNAGRNGPPRGEPPPDARPFPLPLPGQAPEPKGASPWPET